MFTYSTDNPITKHITHMNLLEVWGLCVCVCTCVCECVYVSCGSISGHTTPQRGTFLSLEESCQVWSSEHTDWVQLTATTAGFSILAAQTTLLYGGRDNDGKADRSHFLQPDNTINIRLYDDSQTLSSTWCSLHSMEMIMISTYHF